MNLTVCISGEEFSEVPMRNGDDAFNAAAERTALDKAYMLKEQSPDEVVTILVDTSDERYFVTEDEGDGIEVVATSPARQDLTTELLPGQTLWRAERVQS